MTANEEIKIFVFEGHNNWVYNLMTNSNLPSAMADYEDCKNEYISEIKDKLIQSDSSEDFIDSCKISNTLGYEISECLSSILGDENKSCWEDIKEQLANALNDLEEHEYNWRA